MNIIKRGLTLTEALKQGESANGTAKIRRKSWSETIYEDLYLEWVEDDDTFMKVFNNKFWMNPTFSKEDILADDWEVVESNGTTVVIGDNGEVISG